jgi:hypothetical protein
MLIEIKPRGIVEYQGQSRSGHILTIEKQGKGYMVRSRWKSDINWSLALIEVFSNRKRDIRITLKPLKCLKEVHN